MSKTTKTQIRGTCQCCGRDQAVIGRRMSKHGYTVEHGWFAGVCRGQNFEPMQTEREEADRICREVAADCDELDVRAAALKAGTAHPAICKGSWLPAERRYAEIAWADAASWQQESAKADAIFRAEQRAKMGRDFVRDLQLLAARTFGQPLREVRASDAPAPILRGEQRIRAGRVYTAGTAGRQVRCSYERDGKTFWTAIGTRTWRALPIAQAEAAAA